MNKIILFTLVFFLSCGTDDNTDQLDKNIQGLTAVPQKPTQIYTSTL